MLCLFLCTAKLWGFFDCKETEHFIHIRYQELLLEVLINKTVTQGGILLQIL